MKKQNWGYKTDAGYILPQICINEFDPYNGKWHLVNKKFLLHLFSREYSVFRLDPWLYGHLSFMDI